MNVDIYNEPEPGERAVVECEGRCGRVVECEWTADPFNQDVNNRTLMLWLCDDCYSESAADI